MPWVALTVLLAAGCATMPDSGEPQAVSPPPSSDQGVQVRVIPVPPRDGQSPREVLQNFLDASISDEHDYQTARQYLTPEAVKTWQPDSGAVVLNDTTPHQSSGDGDLDHATVTLHSQEVATLDAKHTYQPKSDQFGATFTLINVAKDADKDGKDATTKAQWRITDLPSTLILNQTNFHNAYQQVDRYFFTLPDPSGSGGDQPVLVPDPIFIRRRIDPASAAAAALAQGPSDWLRPAVRSAFDGTEPAATVDTDDPTRPKLQINGVDFVISERQCQQMVAQLYFTLASLNGSGPLDRVTLTSSRHGSCELTPTAAKALPWAPGALADSAGVEGQPYARKADTGQLERLDTAATVPGVLGAVTRPGPLAPVGGRVQGPFAVRRDGKAAAVISEDGKSLYVANLDDSVKQLGAPLLTSHAAQGLASPSWDGLGGLWVVDRDPAGPQVWLLRGQNRTAVPVGVPAGSTVDTIKLSSDGTRAALLLRDATSGAHSLAIGLVQRGGGSPSAVSIVGVRLIAPQLSDVTSVSWADPDQLLVLGKEVESVPQLHYVPTDGSPGVDNPLQSVDGMTVVAAPEDRTDAVLADSKDQDHTVYSLSGSGQPQWKVYGKGVMPTYPG
ncbi:LpqB family beta-propeller domain-containing protein [Kitasatospora sp. NPDC008050]|uniref:LpqB family beta-propeller domain-containing protein n=1 Tax=Kitasatospora sp. NPDC008050 TaxID=3364021 RepID=UPI0036EF55DA